MSEQNVKIGDVVLFKHRSRVIEGTVLRIANHPRYDAQSVEIEFSDIFGTRTKWLEIADLKGVLPR